MQTNNNLKQQKFEVKKSHELMEAMYEISVDSYKFFNLAGSKLKNKLFNITDEDVDKAIAIRNKSNKELKINEIIDDEILDKKDFLVIIKRDEVESQLPSLSKSHKLIPRLNKIVDDLSKNNSFSIPEHTETKLSWSVVSVVKKIEYNKENESISVQFTPTLRIKNLLNPDNQKGFDLDEVKNLNFATTMKQVAIYNLCHKDLAIGNTPNISIEKLRKLTKTPDDKYTIVGNFISRVIKYQVEFINKNSTIKIEYEPIKTGRKITHIKFFMEHKNKNSLYSLKLKSNNLRANLISFGISPNKVKSFTKYNPGELLEAYKSTDKARIKAKSINQKFSVEGYFVKTVANIHSQSRTEEKGRSVAEFLETLSIENKNLLLVEFENSLSAEIKNSIEKQRNSNDESVRESAKKTFNSNYYKWIYYNNMVIK
jgi:plasmid replication initiation protein